MGNRAHVIFTNKQGDISPAVYLHWNGGPESVYAFLDELRRRKAVGSVDYAAARFVHVAADFFDASEEGCGCMSLGVTNGPDSLTPDDLRPLNCGDNGIFVVELGGEEFKVRRFIERCVDRMGEVGWELQEMSKAQVKAEKEKAYRDPYHTGEGSKAKEGEPRTMAEQFAKLRPKVSPIG